MTEPPIIKPHHALLFVLTTLISFSRLQGFSSTSHWSLERIMQAMAINKIPKIKKNSIIIYIVAFSYMIFYFPVPTFLFSSFIITSHSGISKRSFPVGGSNGFTLTNSTVGNFNIDKGLYCIHGIS